MGNSCPPRKATQLPLAAYTRLKASGRSHAAVNAQIAPLLGLFGTVLGFIQVYQQMQGDGLYAHLNSLSAGIWQALVCTAAGLAVAIPALFGYNYLLTRIKATTTDMHVFIDEFVTKLAEFYSEPER